jgi:integrative and conjugative element protein (TIGR02256 family)
MTEAPVKCLIYARKKVGRLQIGADAVEVMRRYIQVGEHVPEAGGVLLGRHILGTSDIVVDFVTTPLLGDRQSRFRFFRARRKHQEVIDQAWRESGGTCTYVGEWHTHPEPEPSPSLIDRLNWQHKLLRDYFSEVIFFIIVGITEIRVWEGHRYSQPVMLEQVRVAS